MPKVIHWIFGGEDLIAWWYVTTAMDLLISLDKFLTTQQPNVFLLFWLHTVWFYVFFRYISGFLVTVLRTLFFELLDNTGKQCIRLSLRTLQSVDFRRFESIQWWSSLDKSTTVPPVVMIDVLAKSETQMRLRTNFRTHYPHFCCTKMRDGEILRT